MRFFELLFGSFHSAAIYRHVRKAANFCLGYTLLLVMVCTLFITAYYTHVVHGVLFVTQGDKPALFDDVVTQIANQIPVMTFKDNKLVTQVPAATVIKINVEAFGQQFNDMAIATIDTTGATTHTTMKTPMLITTDEFIYNDKKETKIRPLSDFNKRQVPTIVINRAVALEMATTFIQVVHQNLTKFYVIVGGICWLSFTMFIYVCRIIMLMVLGLAGLLIANILKSPLTFAASVSLAAISFTPVALLETALLIGFGYSVHVFTLFAAGVVGLAAAIHVSDPETPSSTITS